MKLEFPNSLAQILYKVVVNNGLSMLLTFAFYTAVSAVLFEKGYGVFFYNVSTILVAVMLSELGVNISLQKLGNSQHSASERAQIFANMFYLKLTMSLLLFIVLLTFGFVKLHFFVVFFVSVLVSIGFNHILTYYQVRKEEKLYLNLIIFGNVIRLLLLGLYYLLDVHDIRLFVMLFFVVQIFVLLCRYQVWTEIFSPLKIRVLLNALLGNKYLHLITLVVALLVRLEFFILGTSDNQVDLESYSIYFTYTLFIPPLISAVNSTLLVRIEEFDTLTAYNRFAITLNKVLLPLMVVTVFFIALFLLVWFDFSTIDLARYLLVFLALLSTLIVKPWGLLLHYFNVEHELFIINLVQTLIALILGIYFYSLFGVNGLVLSFFIQQVGANVFVLIRGRRLLKKHE